MQQMQIQRRDMVINSNRVEIMDTPNKEHLSVKDTCCCPVLVLNDF